MTSGDTIVAISSAVGPAARMIVRASGPGAVQLAGQLAADPLPEAGTASRTTLRVNDLSVPAWLYLFHAPRSYTGEDLVEFHLPGSPLLARLLLDTLTTNGGRPAQPGEFTARAYFNGRIDLTEAEGVAATIAASGERELRAARQLLAGELARRLRPVTDLLAETLALVEVGIDFSDEDVTFLTAAELLERLGRADAMLRDLLDTSARFERLAHEPQVVLVGRPNAGKSTLLNALAGRERAVTSPVAGTTRDVLTAEVPLARGIVRLTDAAGLDETEALGACDAIALQMRRQALRAAEAADVLVLVRDGTDDRPDLSLPRPADLVVRTKADLASVAPEGLVVSAHAGTRLPDLRDALDRLAFGDQAAAASGGASLALNARHLQAVADARAALARAAERIRDGGGPELVALELREALDAVGGVVGMVSPDDLLGRVFSAFCIGK
jgi:tRNA modification GTPase